jgi:hypothetical protein
MKMMRSKTRGIKKPSLYKNQQNRFELKILAELTNEEIYLLYHTEAKKKNKTQIKINTTSPERVP